MATTALKSMREVNHELIGPIKPLEETIPFDDGLVTISANPDRLSLDFLRAATGVGIDTKAVEPAARRLNTYFSPQGYYEQIAKDIRSENPGSLLERGVAAAAIATTRSPGRGKYLLGSFHISSSKDSAAIYLNLEAIVKMASGSAAYFTRGRPPAVRLETAATEISRGVYSVWRHERQHFIEAFDPKSIKEDRRDKNLSALIPGTAVLLTYGGLLGLFSATGNLGTTIEEVLTNSLICGTLSLVEGLGVSEIMYLSRKSERAARTATKIGTNLPNLFEFQFEEQMK